MPASSRASEAKLSQQQQSPQQLQETLLPYENHSVFAFSRAICQGGRHLATLEKLEPVLSLLPNITKRGTEGRGLSKLQEGTVVGAAGFLVESKGLFLDKIWPLISGWLCCSVLKSQREVFVAALFTQFARIAVLIRSCRNELTDAFISLLEETAPENTNVLYGILKGLGVVRSPFSRAQTESLLQWVQTKMLLKDENEKEAHEEKEEGEEEEEEEGGKEKDGKGKGKKKGKREKKGKKKKRNRLMKEKGKEDGENEKVSDEKKKALSSAKHQTLILKMIYRLIEREHDDPILIPVYKIAVQHLDPNKFIECATLTAAIRLVVRCALLLPDHCHEVVRHLCLFLNKADIDEPNPASSLSYNPEKWTLCKTIMKGMQTINEKYPYHYTPITESIQTFLVDRLSKQKKNKVVVTANPVIHDTVISILSSICLLHMEERGFRSVRVLLHSLSSRLQILYEEYQRKVESHTIETQNSIRILMRTLSRMTVLLNKPVVTSMVLPILMKPLMGANSFPTVVDKLLFDEISDIAVCGDGFAYTTVVDFLLNEYFSVALNPGSARSTAIHQTVPNNLFFVATHLQKEFQIGDFLLRMLKLFEKIGYDLQRKRFAERVGVVGALGVLLPILSALLKHPYVVKRSGGVKGNDDNDELHLEKNLPKLLHNVWFFIVYFGFVDQNRVLPEWSIAVRNIATCVPVYLSEGSYFSLELEVEIQSYLRNALEDTDGEIRKLLTGRLPPAYHTYVRDLTPAQCAYVLSVYHCEVLRSSEGMFSPLFTYLSHLSTISAPLLPLIKGISDLCYTNFLESMKKRREGGEEGLEQRAEDFMQFFVVHFCSREQDTRTASDKFINGMIQDFPQLLWSRRCLNTVLHLLEEFSQPRSSFDTYVVIKIPDCQYDLLLPEQDEERVIILGAISKLCSAWLETAMAKAPLEVGSLLQEYVQSYRSITQSFGTSSSAAAHLGLTVALNAGLQGRVSVEHLLPKAARKSQEPSLVAEGGKEGGGGGGGAAFMSSLKTKSLYTGEVSGMLILLQQSQSDEKEKIMKQIVARIIGNLSETISKIRVFAGELKKRRPHGWEGGLGEGEGGEGEGLESPEIDGEQFDGDVCRGAAILIQQPQLDPALLHAICWAPFVVYTPSSMNSGIFAWRWLLAARPEYVMSVMIELRDAWVWTIEERIGLFSDTQRPPSPLSISQSHPSGPHHSPEDDDVSASEKYQKRTSNIAPHRLFIDWILEFFPVVLSGKGMGGEKGVIEEMLVAALKRPHYFSTLRESMGARFRFLLFCFEFLHGNHSSTAFVENKIRSGCYNAACQWFCWPPYWHSFAARATVEQEVANLVTFCKVLDKDHSLLRRHHHDHKGDEEEMAWMEEIFKFLESSDVVVGGSEVGGSGGGMGGAGGGGERRRRGSTVLDGEESRIRGWSLRGKKEQPESVKPAEKDHFSRLTERRTYLLQLVKLLQLLLGHEIDRIVTWHNPQSTLKLAVADQDLYSPARALEWNTQKWRRFISLAWSVSPRLAFQLGVRFPYRKVRSTLELFAKENVEQVADDPAALPYIVARHYVQANIPELRHLLHWAPCEPPLALALLHSSYSVNPYITQYAVRVLKTFSADTIIFYLPQLVQTVRYDVSGVVEDYLIKASQRSPLLAHQIIWNTLTIEESVEGKLPLPGHPSGETFFQKSTALREGVRASMSGKAITLYSDEFDFFNAITTISELLLPIAPNDRRARLKEELRKIPIKGCLYLPTSPNTTVLSINYDRASPMQSAAKVPIMVSFLVTDEAAIQDVAEEKKGGRKAEALENEEGEGEGEEGGDGDLSEEEDESDWPIQSSRKGTGGRDRSESGGGSLMSPRGRKEYDEGDETEAEDDDGGVGKVGLRDPHPSNTHWQSCIFKAGDDIRQDVLALQVIELCKRIFQSVGLDLYLFPYRVIATAPGSGIIEVVPDAESRDRLGKKVEGKSLFEYFVQKHGPPESVGFQRARRNFMSSMAAYSVISFVLQVKDRHNGNLLVDEEGHIVHIDFGFLFDISPGGNLKFERSHFKLSTEMIELMGGRPDSSQFKWFMAQTVRGYLALREHSEAIITLVSLMMDTDFPCFTDRTIANLRERLSCDKSEKDAATFMTYKVIDSCQAVSKFTTFLYDVFQNWSNGIDY